MKGKGEDYDAGRDLHNLFREIFAVHAALGGVMDEVHEKAGLTTPQARIIRVLDGPAPVTVPDIASILGVSRQFVQKVCNDLLSMGFLEFADNPRHKRSKRVSLTEKGRFALSRFRRNEEELIKKALPGIDPGLAVEARELLADIREALKKISSDPPF